METRDLTWWHLYLLNVLGILPDREPKLMELVGRQVHTGLAPSESALRTLLEVPPDLPLVQWQIAPLASISPHLERCTWQIVGCLVPVTEEPPGYPFIQYLIPPTRLQAWLWRTSKPDRRYTKGVQFGWNRPWGDLRWHPERSLWMAMELLPSDGPEVTTRVWRWLHTSHQASRGHPWGDHCPWIQEDLRQKIEEAIATVRRRGQYPTHARIWSAMGYAGDPKTLVRWCTRRQLDLQRLKD